MKTGSFLKYLVLALLPVFSAVQAVAEVRVMLPVSSATYSSGGAEVALAAAVDGSENIYVAGYRNNDLLAVKYSKNLVQGAAQTYSNGQSGNRWNGIAVDSMGNIIVAGRLFQTAANQDFYTVKYAPNFASQISSAAYSAGNYDEALAVKVDSKDNVFVAGYFDDGTKNFYTVKYDANLNQISSASYDSGAEDQALALAVDSDDNVIVAGFATGATKNFFIRKYDNNLNALYSAAYDSGGDDRLTGVAVDKDNNILALGRVIAGDMNIVAIKYDGFLNEVSSASYDSGANDFPTGIGSDSNGNVVVTGYNGGNDFLTIKYDSSFNVLSTAAYNAGSDEKSYAVAVDASDNVIVAGKVTNSDEDLFIIKYNASPRITEVSPLYIGETANVTFKGRGFLSDSVFSFDDSGISTGTLTYIPPDQVNLSVTLSSSVWLGVTTVTVTNSNGEYATDFSLPVTRLRKTIPAGVSDAVAGVNKFGPVTVTVPSGSFSQQETFTVYTFTATPGDVRQVGDGLYVGVSPASDAVQNYTIKIYYSSADLGAYPASSLSLAYYDSVSGWVDVSSSVNASERSVTGSTKKTGVKFAIVKEGETAGIPTPGGLGGALVYPNPYRPGTGGDFDSPTLGEGIVFAGFSAGASFKLLIIDLAGQLVFNKSCTADADGKYLWNAKSSSGGEVATGVYIYRVEGGGAERKGKLSIIR